MLSTWSCSCSSASLTCTDIWLNNVPAGLQPWQATDEHGRADLLIKAYVNM